MAAGERAELAVQHHLNRNLDHHYTKSEGKNTKFDLWCPRCDSKVEVKNDRMAPRTGNICIERNLFAKSSSDIVAYVIGDKAYIYSFEQLWKAIIQLAVDGKTTKKMLGDRDANSAVLVKVEDILPLAEEVSLREEE